MWSVSAITLFSLTRRVSCFLLTFNADTHFGCVSLVTHACDVPRFVRLSCRRRNSSLRRPLQSVAFARLPTRVPDQCRLRVASLRRTGRYLGRFASSANDFSHGLFGGSMAYRVLACVSGPHRFRAKQMRLFARVTATRKLSVGPSD
jgi:hypothetical protein